MYKSKLMELCHRRKRDLPEYTTIKYGPDHMPRFTATVKVDGSIFETPALCKSSKEAQNTAARIAFDHFNAPSPSPVERLPSAPAPPPLATVDSQIHGFPSAAPLPTVPLVAPPPEMQLVAAVPPLHPVSPLPSSLPIPPPGLLATKNDVKTKPVNAEVLQQNHEDDTQTSEVNTVAIGSIVKNLQDTLHIYKNRLQQHAQKHNLGFPVYTCEAEGPPHARLFKSKVTFNGKSYQTQEFFPTLKEAEQAAAKIACQMLSIDAIQQEEGLYKNLLQELAQKKGLVCPLYETATSGLSHRPVFVSTVQIGSDTFRGAEAKTKKQAEMNAAKVAYCALTGSSTATESSRVISVNECALADNLTPNIQPPAMIKKHQDTTDEEAEIHAKRAKFSPENMNMNAHLPGSSQSNSPPEDSNLPSCVEENSTCADPVTEQPVENQPLLCRTVVFPRTSGMPIPECATMMPYADGKWVAYKVELKQDPPTS